MAFLLEAIPHSVGHEAVTGTRSLDRQNESLRGFAWDSHVDDLGIWGRSARVFARPNGRLRSGDLDPYQVFSSTATDWPKLPIPFITFPFSHLSSPSIGICGLSPS